MVKRTMLSTLLMIFCSVAVMVLAMTVSTATATSQDDSTVTSSPAETSPAGTATPAHTVDPTEAPTQELSPTASTTPSTSEEPLKTTQPTSSQTALPTTATPTSVPTSSRKPTWTPKPVSTTPPKLEILTPPALTAGADAAPPTQSQLPDTTAGLVSPSGTIALAPTNQVEHVDQVEIDPGFRMSDFIGILCHIAYVLAGIILLVGIVRAVILLVFKKDILPSKKERLKEKEKKAQQAAIQRQETIQTDVTPEEFDIHQDDWNWK